jgi:HEAT repeat protein
LAKVLVDLLDRENRLIETTLRESHEQVGVSRKYGDAYGDYIDDLRDTVAEVADLHDPRVIKILMMSSFAPDSIFGRKLAILGNTLIEPLLERAASDLEIERSVAFEMFGIVVDVNRGHLPAASMASIKKVLTAGVEDHGVRARYMAVHALGLAGDASDIPLLRKVSQTDPEVYEGGPAPRYVVRDEALKSIQRIHDRG